MGIFNRSIPTYTVDTANKLRVTTPLPEEEPNTYIDDAFDPILNQAVRNRLLKQWGNPISATLAGYYEMLDNAFVGSSKQWGALGPGMGVLGAFGRTMDKGGDAIIGTLTEGVKGLTGQGVESPFRNIFVKDEDYTGGRLLAAMGNSMAKMAGAPELTEEDFGGLWNVPSIGLELATDPGIMGGAMAKAGGAVGKLSTSEVLQNLGKSGRSPLADVGQLLSNYDDAMSKIALDVTAPGTRQAITKFRNHLNQVFQHSSAENYANRTLRKAKNAEEAFEVLKAAKNDPKLKMQLALNASDDAAKNAAYATQYGVEDFNKHVDSVRKNNETFKSIRASRGITMPSPHIDVPNVLNDELVFTNILDKQTQETLKATYKSLPQSEKAKFLKDYSGYLKTPNTPMAMRASDEQFQNYIKTTYKKLSPDEKLEFLATHSDYFKNGNAEQMAKRQAWYKKETNSLLKTLKTKYPVKTLPESEVAHPVKTNIALPTELEYRHALDTISKTSADSSKEYAKLNALRKQLSKLSVELEDLKEYADNDWVPYRKYRSVKKKYDILLEVYENTRSELTSKFGNATDEAYSIVEAYEHGSSTRFTKPVKDSVLKVVEATNAPDVLKELDSLHDTMLDVRKVKPSLDSKLSNASFEDIESVDKPTERFLQTFFGAERGNDVDIFKKLYNMSDEEAWKTLTDYFDRRTRIENYLDTFSKNMEEYTLNYNVTVDEAARRISTAPRKGVPSSSSDFEIVSDTMRKLADDLALDNPKILTNEEYPLDIDLDSEGLRNLSNFIAQGPDLRDYLKRLRKKGFVKGNRKAVAEYLDILDEYGITTKELELIDTYDMYTVDGFLTYVSHNVDGYTAAYNIIHRLVDGKPQIFEDSPISVSPSVLYNTRDAKIIRNAVAYLEVNLKNILKDYGLFEKASSRDLFWETINKDPVLQSLFTPQWRVDEYLDTLTLMFKKQGLSVPNETLLRENFFNEINKYPKLKQLLGVEDAFIQDASNVFFGHKGNGKHKYTLQRQLLALDRFTEHVLDTVDPYFLSNITKNSDDVAALIDKYGLETVVNHPESIFKGVVKKNVGSAHGEAYTAAMERIRKTAIALAHGDVYSELYKFAKDAQERIFEPLKMKLPKEGLSGKVINKLKFAPDSKAAKELKSLQRADSTDILNDYLREHDAIHSIADARQFAFSDKSNMYGPWRVGENAYADKSLNEYVEVKFNNIGPLKLSGSTLPGKIRKYSKLRDKSYVPKDVYPIRQYLNNAGSDLMELERRKSVLRAIAKADPNDTLGHILKDVGGVDDSVKHLFNKTDLTPKYVDDIAYDYHKSVGNKIISENEIVSEISEQPPKNLVDNRLPTYNQTLTRDVYKAAGLEQLSFDIDDMSGGKGFEHLEPEDVETLRETYGDDAVDLFSLIHKATVSDSNAKFTKTNTYDTVYGKAIAEKSAKLMKSKTASDDLRMYDMIQTLEHGDSLSYAALMDELVTSGGHVGMRVGGERLATLRTSLTDFVNTVNSQLGTSVLKLHEVTGKKGTYLGVVFDVKNSKKILKSKFKTLKFADDSVVVFEAPAALPESLRKFKESEAYTANDEFAREMSNYVQGIHSKLGFNYEPTPHVKHVLSDLDAKHAPLLAEFYQDLNLDGLKELSNRLLNSDSFNHLYGTFGAVPFGRSLRGGNWRYNFDDYNTFDFTPDRVLSSSLSEGVLSNTNVQSFVGLFVNDNFKLNQYFKTVEELEDVLYARLESGKMSGNLDNLDIIAPVYNESGKVLRFQRFDKTSRSSLEKALKTEDAIIVPSHIVAPLDAWCKKDAKMSNRIYRFFNRMFALPYKIGVLANPGFFLGNVNDAYLKQATTLSEKYGTSVAEELVRVAESIRDVQHLNNSAAKAYDKILQFFDKEKITVLPSERPMMAMNINPKARKKVVDFLNGKVIVKGKEVDIEQFLRPEEVDSMRLWLYINSNQPTVFSKNGFRDLSKEDVQISSDDGFLSRIFYGSHHFNPNKPSTWGVFKNPATEGIFQVSESSETLFRSANVLNALKHEGYDAAGLAKILGEGYDEAAAKKLHVDTVNAMNVMYNSNFNYEAQSELMDKIGYVVPFPTFFVKNFAYWMDLLVNNPEYIDSAITIQEGLWSDRDEEVSEDRFMAEAKGRGAVPISDGDDKGLSKFFKGIYKQTPLNSMFSAFNLLNHPVENLTNRVHPLISTPIQLAQAEMGVNNVGLATPEDAEDVKYRPYSFNQFERNVKYPDEEFNSLNFLFHKLNPYDRTIGNTMRLPHKIYNRDVQLSDIAPSVFQPDF